MRSNLFRDIQAETSLDAFWRPHFVPSLDIYTLNAAALWQWVSHHLPGFRDQEHSVMRKKLHKNLPKLLIESNLMFTFTLMPLNSRRIKRVGLPGKSACLVKVGRQVCRWHDISSGFLRTETKERHWFLRTTFQISDWRWCGVFYQACTTGGGTRDRALWSAGDIFFSFCFGVHEKITNAYL